MNYSLYFYSSRKLFLLCCFPFAFHLLPFEVAVPHQVHKTTFQRNFFFDPISKLYGILSLKLEAEMECRTMDHLYLSLVHRRQVPHVTHNGPGGHHHQQVGHHGYL